MSTALNRTGNSTGEIQQLNEQGRAMFFAICGYCNNGMSNATNNWQAKVANSWRTGVDHHDQWSMVTETNLTFVGMAAKMEHQLSLRTM